jgi:uncharacterized protein (DUF849 family)
MSATNFRATARRTWPMAPEWYASRGRSMSPYLPITPDEIVAESVAAAEAGGSIIHLHARDPRDGRPSADPDLFMQFTP